MPELGQIQTDIGELKTNVSVIKTEIQDMKQSITNSVDKISNSMTILATVTEKLNTNASDHKIIHKRIDDLEEDHELTKEKIDGNKNTLIELKLVQESLVQKIKEEDEEEKNSFLNKIKDKSVEYVIMIVGGLFLYILISNIPKYISFIGSVSK